MAPAVINVNSLADILNPPTGVVTLRSAIQAANATPGGNTINLTVAGTYKITLAGADENNNATGDFDILPGGGNLNIVNTSGGAVIVDGNHLDRVFDINPAIGSTPAFTVTMQGFTIQNGSAPAGDGYGGGIKDQGNASLTLTNMAVTDNASAADGGGIAMFNTVSAPWTLTINNSTITDNNAAGAGGGIETDGTGIINTTAGSAVSDNDSAKQGAGIWLDAIVTGSVFQSANLTMTGTDVSSNEAINGEGGGIGNAGNGVVTLTSCTVEDNYSHAMGAGFGDENGQGALSISDSLFRDNVALGDGGGIQTGGTSASIANSFFEDNVSDDNGAGLFADGATLSVVATTFVSNDSNASGGGIEVNTTGTGVSGSSIINCTITANTTQTTAGGNGGGIDAGIGFTGALTLLNDTINANTANNGGGVHWAGSGTINVEDTIIAGNTATTGPDLSATATFTDLGGNLIGISGPGSGNSGFTSVTTQSGTVATPLNPLLGVLQDNGGPTVGAAADAMTLETEALLPGSPAIDKGLVALIPSTSLPLLVDARNFARPDIRPGAKPDVGAFEFQDANLTVALTSPPVAINTLATFTITVTNNGPGNLPADNSTVTVTLPAGISAASSLTFTVGALAPGALTTITVEVVATALGTQTVSAAVFSPDANPNSATASTTISVVTAQERFVQALYVDNLHRLGSIAELDGWVAVLNAPGGSQAGVAAAIFDSFEARDDVVKLWYLNYLGRAASGGEEVGWVNLLAVHTEEQVLSQILATTEFYNHAQTLIASGTGDQRFVGALYQLLLNRTASASEVAGWVNLLPTVGRQGVSLSILTSQEYRTILVTGYYTNLLHRTPDALEVAGWVMSGLDAATITLDFESSPEFFSNG